VDRSISLFRRRCRIVIRLGERVLETRYAKRARSEI
jgi:hypothetical protein